MDDSMKGTCIIVSAITLVVIVITISFAGFSAFWEYQRSTVIINLFEKNPQAAVEYARNEALVRGR